MYWFKETLVSIYDAQISSDVQYYLEQLQMLYDYVGDAHYQSRYIRLRTTCPYFAYCTLFYRIRLKIKDGEFPSPYDVMGDDCRCENCLVGCDSCGITFPVYSKFVNSRASFKVHHRNYTPPLTDDEWKKSFAILCNSCHSKITWNIQL